MLPRYEYVAKSRGVCFVRPLVGSGICESGDLILIGLEVRRTHLVPGRRYAIFRSEGLSLPSLAGPT
jgi:hypothetical protein